MKSDKNTAVKNIVVFLISGLLFFVITIPFRKIFSVFTVTEVRPVAVLNPFLGICYGWPSAIAIAIANFIADAVSGYPTKVLIQGLPLQLLYTIVPYYMWKFLTKGEEHIHRIDSLKRVFKYALVSLVFAVISGLGVGYIVFSNYGSNFLSSSFFVFLNNFDFAILLGYPLLIASNQIISRRSGTKRILTEYEKIILIADLITVISVTVIGISVYKTGNVIGTYNTWNTIYFYSAILINAIMLIACIPLFIANHKK